MKCLLLLLRVRPGADAFVECNIEEPYEIHLVKFKTDNDFTNFMEDQERKRFLHLKEQRIKPVLEIKGIKL